VQPFRSLFLSNKIFISTFKKRSFLVCTRVFFQQWSCDKVKKTTSRRSF